MDFSVGVFDCVAVNSRQFFVLLMEGNREALMADTGAVSSGSCSFCNIEKRIHGHRADARAWVRAGGPGERLRPPLGRFSHNGVFFFSSLIS
jgi:hypothetical protein